MSNQPFSLYEIILKCAFSHRQYAHFHIAEAKKFYAKGDKARFHGKMAEFYSNIKTARFNARNARIEREHEASLLEAAE